jgi:hypothetical protein
MSQSKVEGSARSKRAKAIARLTANPTMMKLRRVVDATSQVETKPDSDGAEDTEVPQAEVEGLTYIEEGKASSELDHGGAEEDMFDDAR